MWDGRWRFEVLEPQATAETVLSKENRTNYDTMHEKVKSVAVPGVLEDNSSFLWSWTDY